MSPWTALLLTTLTYTVPQWEGHPCDTVRVECDAAGLCDTTIVYTTERMGIIEVWWAPRWGQWAMLYSKDVAGLEGLRDTINVPSDTIGSAYLIAVDAAGNRACYGNVVTVNLPPVSVPHDPRPAPLRRLRWYDVQGRYLYTGVDPPKAPSGIYFGRDGFGRRKVVVVR